MIVQFKPKSKTNRVEALMKGKIRVFTCDTCGYDFEVLFNDFPKQCPNCGLTMDWRNSTYDDGSE